MRSFMYNTYLYKFVVLGCIAIVLLCSNSQALEQYPRALSTTKPYASKSASNLKFILTGGPGVGKTSVGQALKYQGFMVTAEAFGDLFGDYVCKEQDKGLSQKESENNFWKFIITEAVAFRRVLMCRQLELEEAAEKMQGIMFADRGTPDIVAFGDIFGVYMTPEFRSLAKSHEYNKYVFFLDPLPKELYKQTELRHESYEESIKMHNAFKDLYRSYGYTIIDVPFDTVAHRVDFILKQVDIVCPGYMSTH